MQKIKILILLSILVAVAAAPAIGDDTVIFDSGRLTVNPWHVHQSQHTIQTNQSSNANLCITKNTPQLSIHAGFLVLNRRLIPLTHFLHGRETTYEKKIRLRQANRLRVLLVGSPGASITATIRSEAAESQPPPTVTFSADPETIDQGSSSTLVWSSENADTCTIDPSIGTVALSGSMMVSPSATTTYTITATGPEGTVTSSATITVNPPPPMITFSATPTQLLQEQSSTLTWNTANADGVSIDQGIGDVQLNGSLAVFPETDTTYTIKATGPGGTSTESVTVTVVQPLSIQILSPQQGITFDRPDVMVCGTFTNNTGDETGITVNGITAMVFGNQFAANHIPLEEGENTISVKATSASGDTAEETILVYAETNKNYIKLTADMQSGITPFETTLRINSSLPSLTSTITYTGPGTLIFQDSAEANTYPIRLEQKGIYYLTAEASDDQGDAYQDTVAIMVFSADALDNLLQAKWASMKTALIAGDIDKALTFHHQRYYERYAAIYQALGTGLSTLASKMSDISWICYMDGMAKYRIRQTHEVKGQMVTITYYIYFSQGENGLWKIERY
ncbi:exported hypothetical protein [Desulfosarcina cetonica]|uniref:hypothetical protein n=1 Tax=Desulfosarcina cetonica TaxID=90730 RepID=UPI0006D0F361|nr:hypothetical protein [Desulfosarcina cetonica]VTR64207.1 exported hypothetical protein [Desulfosarcina cetonica]